MATITDIMTLIFGSNWDAYGLIGLVVLMFIVAAFGRALPAIALAILGLGVLILPNGAALIVVAGMLGMAWVGFKIISVVVANAGDNISISQYGDGNSANVWPR